MHSILEIRSLLNKNSKLYNRFHPSINSRVTLYVGQIFSYSIPSPNRKNSRDNNTYLHTHKNTYTVHTNMYGENNGNTKKINRICLCWLHWKNSSWQHWMFFFRLFTLCFSRVSALVNVLSDSPCERMGKWETCPIFKEDRTLARLAGASVTKNFHIIRCIESDSF
jgi:hypothetical protein